MRAGEKFLTPRAWSLEANHVHYSGMTPLGRLPRSNASIANAAISPISIDSIGKPGIPALEAAAVAPISIVESSVA